jgi:hypothetical protein
MNLNSAVAGLKMAHLLEITSAFEFAVLTLTVPGLRLRKYQNPLCFRVSAPFSSSLTAEFRMNGISGLYPGGQKLITIRITQPLEQHKHKSGRAEMGKEAPI